METKTVKEGRTGKRFRAEDIEFFFTDASGIEQYAGAIYFVGDYIYVPSTYRVRKSGNKSVSVIRD